MSFRSMARLGYVGPAWLPSRCVAQVVERAALAIAWTPPGWLAICSA